MLINNHESHIIFEFIVLTNENRIQSFSLIFHFTHCMQSLNVEIIQFYKHWHDQIIQNAVVTLFVKYSIDQFLNDLTKIRNNTFIRLEMIRFQIKPFGSVPDSDFKPNRIVCQETKPLKFRIGSVSFGLKPIETSK